MPEIKVGSIPVAVKPDIYNDAALDALSINSENTKFQSFRLFENRPYKT